MSRVFLTGATGMIGSNIAEQLVERGDDVRALVREGSDAAPLEAMGVEIVRGDITDADQEEDMLRVICPTRADFFSFIVGNAARLHGRVGRAHTRQIQDINLNVFIFFLALVDSVRDEGEFPAVR